MIDLFWRCAGSLADFLHGIVQLFDDFHNRERPIMQKINLKLANISVNKPIDFENIYNTYPPIPFNSRYRILKDGAQ